MLRTCHALGVPVVARGAGTGLSGGALPLGNGVLLSLAKLMRILEIDPLSRTARVQPGVRNLAISEAAAAHNLYYAPDPSSQIACSIGGNVAENAGGVHCLKYGVTVNNVLGVQLVLIDTPGVFTPKRRLDRAMVAALPMDRGAPLRNRLLRQVVLYWGVAFLLYPIQELGYDRGRRIVMTTSKLTATPRAGEDAASRGRCVDQGRSRGIRA